MHSAASSSSSSSSSSHRRPHSVRSADLNSPPPRATPAAGNATERDVRGGVLKERATRTRVAVGPSFAPSASSSPSASAPGPPPQVSHAHSKTRATRPLALPFLSPVYPPRKTEPAAARQGSTFDRLVLLAFLACLVLFLRALSGAGVPPDFDYDYDLNSAGAHAHALHRGLHPAHLSVDPEGHFSYSYSYSYVRGYPWGPDASPRSATSGGGTGEEEESSGGVLPAPTAGGAGAQVFGPEREREHGTHDDTVPGDAPGTTLTPPPPPPPFFPARRTESESETCTERRAEHDNKDKDMDPFPPALAVDDPASRYALRIHLPGELARDAAQNGRRGRGREWWRRRGAAAHGAVAA